MSKMKPEVKQAWVEALRSGEYNQGKGLLRHPVRDNYCCLGVLCDLHAKETGDVWEDGFKYKFESMILPQEVRDWAGLSSSNPEAGDTSLAYANDNGGKDFNAIANLIEKHL